MPDTGNQYVSLDGSNNGWLTTTMNHPRERRLLLGLVVASVLGFLFFCTTIYYHGKSTCPVNPDIHPTTTSSPVTTTSVPSSTPTMQPTSSTKPPITTSPVNPTTNSTPTVHTTTHAPSTTTQQQSTTTHDPSTTAHAPTTSSHKPTSTTQEPTSTTQKHKTTTGKTSTTDQTTEITFSAPLDKKHRTTSESTTLDELDFDHQNSAESKDRGFNKKQRSRDSHWR